MDVQLKGCTDVLTPYLPSLAAGISIACLSIASVAITCTSAHAELADDAFYHQLLKMPKQTGYHPTRTFTIVSDSEHGDQMVADDDDALRFNQLWMQQFQPGYKDRRGGSAFGELFRTYLKQAYKNFRSGHAQSLSAFPDENGSIRTNSYSTSLDYNIKVTDDEVRFKMEYDF
jgi:hypothetical protein